MTTVDHFDISVNNTPTTLQLSEPEPLRHKCPLQSYIKRTLAAIFTFLVRLSTVTEACCPASPGQPLIPVLWGPGRPPPHRLFTPAPAFTAQVLPADAHTRGPGVYFILRVLHILTVLTQRTSHPLLPSTSPRPSVPFPLSPRIFLPLFCGLFSS